MRRPPRSTLSSSSAASDVYKRQRGEDELHQGEFEDFDLDRDLPEKRRIPSFDNPVVDNAPQLLAELEIGNHNPRANDAVRGLNNLVLESSAPAVRHLVRFLEDRSQFCMHDTLHDSVIPCLVSWGASVLPELTVLLRSGPNKYALKCASLVLAARAAPTPGLPHLIRCALASSAATTRCRVNDCVDDTSHFAHG
eukprot:TRINITY_DN3773_c0_g1_i1.p1 TRINITY_DN3773_c0_g1~~TRINITY_DN3773_c0_g1_i1.p1  ORF type:complete len:195 (+),score=19.98 TRINITY_DN3773_c0_g1_i1:48-632(+)